MIESNGKVRSNKIVTVGGTFDTLHEGHEFYLKVAFSQGHEVLIYLSSDEFARSIKTHQVDQYKEREKKLHEFIGELGYSNLYTIRKLVTRDTLEVEFLTNPDVCNRIYMVVITEEYYKDFLELNEKRVKKNLSQFLILQVQKVFIMDQKGQRIDVSSSSLRAGRISKTEPLRY